MHFFFFFHVCLFGNRFFTQMVSQEKRKIQYNSSVVVHCKIPLWSGENEQHILVFVTLWFSTFFLSKSVVLNHQRWLFSWFDIDNRDVVLPCVVGKGKMNGQPRELNSDIIVRQISKKKQRYVTSVLHIVMKMSSLFSEKKS